MSPSKVELDAARGRAIPDVLGPDLDIVFVGIKPGLWSAPSGITSHGPETGSGNGRCRGWTADDRATILNSVILSRGGFVPRSDRHQLRERHPRWDERVRHQLRGPREHHPYRELDATAPDSRGVMVQNKTMNGDRALWCSMSGVSCTANA